MSYAVVYVVDIDGVRRRVHAVNMIPVARGTDTAITTRLSDCVRVYGR